MSYIVICALAATFWAATVTQKAGPFDIFKNTFQSWPKPFSCPFCLMFWLALILVVTGTYLPAPLWVLVEASAAAGIGALVLSFYGILTL